MMAPALSGVPTATVLAIQGNPNATSVAQMMPQCAPVAQVVGVSGAASDEAPVAVVTSVSTTTGQYFTPDQLRVMNGWAPPPDRPHVSDSTPGICTRRALRSTAPELCIRLCIRVHTGTRGGSDSRSRRRTKAE